MYRKFGIRLLIGIAAFIILYLGTVALWAAAVADELVPDVSGPGPEILADSGHLEVLIKVEDPTFYDHHGLDLSNGQGLTTITSSLAATIFLHGEQLSGISGGLQSVYRGVYACCKRIDLGRDVMALVLDRTLPKQAQLNAFMSKAYLGSHGQESIIGFKNAAEAYYATPLAELSEEEFIGLVAMLLAPNYYHPEKNPAAHARRMELIKAVVSGKCEADGLLDLTYEHCAPPGPA